MTSEQRRKAGVDLSLTYLASYYTDWRLAKVLTIQKLLANRNEFYKDVVDDVKQYDDEEGSATIAQEIRNGLYFDAIAQCVQYVEDLFALIIASKKPDFFIRNIITYDAGRITNVIKSFSASGKTMAQAFHFPIDLPFESNEDRATYDKGVNNLIELVKDAVKFYKEYDFFYNQYKHGLAVAMRPFGNKYTEDQIEKVNCGEMEPYLVVYDNYNLHSASKRGTFNTKHGVMMPGFTENVRPFISELQNENNFLKFVFPPDYPNFNIELLVDKSRKVRTCVQIFIYNFSREIKPEEDKMIFALPSDYKAKQNYLITYASKEKVS